MEVVKWSEWLLSEQEGPSSKPDDAKHFFSFESLYKALNKHQGFFYSHEMQA